MKILHLLYDHPDNPWLGGGGAVRAVEINRRLAAKGASITTICGGFPGRSQSVWSDGNLTYYSTKSMGGYLKSRLFYNLGYRKIAAELLQNSNFDLIVNDLSAFSFTSPWRFWNGPTVAILHNLIGARLFKKMGPLGALFFWRERSALHKHHSTIAVSRWLAQQAEAISQKKIAVVYNGVDPKAFEQRGEPQPESLLYLGRIDRFQKGLDILLESFLILQQQRPALQLKVIGDGPDLQSLQKWVADRNLNGVQFLGRLDEERFEWIARSQIVVVPSRFEGWGIVAVEAAAGGRPVVGSGADGLAEAMVDGESGIAVRGGSKEYAEVINRLLDSPERCRAMGEAGRRHAEQFNWNQIAEKQEELYRAAIEGE